jgi:hypothetical protein
MLQKVFNWLHGRTTAFCTAFFISGNIMHWFGKLSMVYVAYMGTLLSAVVGHSIKESMLDDHNGNGNGDDDGHK